MPEERLPRPAPDVAWTVEIDGIALCRRGMPPVHLAYPHAAAWDLMARGLTRPRALRLLAALWDTDERGAEAALTEALRLFRHRGWTTNADG